jgi:hypothetical protein
LHIWVVAKEMKNKRVRVCWKVVFHNTKTLCQRVPRAHYCNIKACRAVITTHTVTDTHTQAPAGIRIFNIRKANFSVLFFALRIWQKQSSFHQTRVCVCAHESWLAKNFAEEELQWCGSAFLEGPRKKQRRKVSKAAYARTHIQHAEGPAEFCADVSPLSYWKWWMGYISGDIPPSIFHHSGHLEPQSDISLSLHAPGMSTLFMLCGYMPCISRRSLCTGLILQLLLTPPFQFIRRLLCDAFEKKSASAFVNFLFLQAQNATCRFGKFA